MMQVRTAVDTMIGHRLSTVETRSSPPVSFTRGEWLTLTMLADLLQFRDERLEALARAEADGHAPAALKRKGDSWLDGRIRDVARECRSRGLADEVASLARQRPAHAHLLGGPILDRASVAR